MAQAENPVLLGEAQREMADAEAWQKQNGVALLLELVRALCLPALAAAAAQTACILQITGYL